MSVALTARRRQRALHRRTCAGRFPALPGATAPTPGLPPGDDRYDLNRRRKPVFACVRFLREVLAWHPAAAPMPSLAASASAACVSKQDRWRGRGAPMGHSRQAGNAQRGRFDPVDRPRRLGIAVRHGACRGSLAPAPTRSPVSACPIRPQRAPRVRLCFGQRPRLAPPERCPTLDRRHH